MRRKYATLNKTQSENLHLWSDKNHVWWGRTHFSSCVIWAQMWQPVWSGCICGLRSEQISPETYIKKDNLIQLVLCGRKKTDSMKWREVSYVSVSLGASEALNRRKARGAEPWYFKARHWYKSPQHRRGSGSSQGRVGRAMGQPLPGLACWYLKMSSLKCWRSLLLLKRSPERLGFCSRVEGTQRGAPLAKQFSSMPVSPPPPFLLLASNTHTPTLQYTADYSQSRSHSFLSSLIVK